MTERTGPVVILDKSYLYGATDAEIKELCDTCCVMVTPGLMYELLKEEEPSRSRCFRKFPQRDNPVELIDRIGVLLRYEAENRIPCKPIYEYRLPVRFEFNRKLADGEYVEPSELSTTMENERQSISEMTSGFLGCIKFIPGWCPTLSGYKPGSSKETIDTLKAEIAHNPETVRFLYRQTHDQRFPPAEIVGPEWAHFRRLQFWIISGLDFICRYGISDFDNVPKKLLHTYIDIHYGIFGVLAGALATRDQFLRETFLLLRPDGLLIE